MGIGRFLERFRARRLYRRTARDARQPESEMRQIKGGWGRFISMCTRAGAAAACAGSAIGSPVPFGPQVVITGNFNDARTVIAADIDGDGDLDPIGASLGGNKASWFENSGTVPPTFTERVITTNAQDARECFAIDMDADGDIDVIVASRQDNKIAWHENLGGGAAWVEHVVASNVIGSWSAWAADIDGDGDMDVLSAGRDDDLISWHENVDGAGLNWNKRIVYSSANRAQKSIAADVDGDGDLDILSASGADSKIAWHENKGGSPITWTNHVIVTNASNAKWVKVADVNADGRLDVLSASEGNGQIRWYRNNGGTPPTFTQFLIGNISGAKVVEPIDFDADGDIDMLSCGIGLDQIAYHENLGGDPILWTTQIISTAADNPLTVFPADLDLDGDPDLLSASFMDNKIAWYENRSIHRSWKTSAMSTIFLGGLTTGSWDVAIADLDRDGRKDVVSAQPYSNTILFHRQVGTQPPTWESSNVSISAPSVRSVAVGDINRDGLPDIAAATENDNGVSYWRNLGGSPPTFSRILVSSFISGARAVVLSDLDLDGDLDMASCGRAGDVVAWHRNMGAGVPAWETYTITGAADGAECIATGDVNGDGLPDLVTGWENADTVALHRNLGGAPTQWSTDIIATGIDGPLSVALADIDHDGDLDVVSVGANMNSVQWHENLGGDVPTWTLRMAAMNVIGAQCVAATDIDQDGDVDFVVGAASEDRIIVLENVGGAPPTFVRRETVGQPDFPRALAIADLDANGQLDIAFASRSDGRVGWMPNKGGEFALPTAATAPETIPNSGVDDVLRIDLAHRGRMGDSAVELVTLELLFEAPPLDSHQLPTPYSTAEANAIFERLRVYRDEGSGDFGVGDTVVATVETLSLTDGVQTIAFVDGDPLVRCEFGESPVYFVTVEATANASAQTPRQFSVTHLTETSSSGQDAVADITIRLEHQANVVSPYVTVGPACQGDTNGDNMVNFADLNNVLSTYNQTGSGLAGDVDGDGDVDFSDLNLVLSNYNLECRP